ncbi:MAG TPA: oligosaccharide flippase family protein [Thermomicrobiales bacterium]|nr:oligosaccharide flippase family protein [Thermomicrobiales bacterium]
MQAGALSLLDQIVIAGVNFAVTIIVARSLGPAAFGLYVLMYTILLLLETVQSSLVTTPHTVLSAPRSGDEYRAYTTSAAKLQALAAFTSAGLFLAMTLVAAVAASSLVPVFLALSLASASTQCQYFTRRVLYTESRAAQALTNDIVTHGLRLALIVTLVMTAGLTLAGVFAVVGISFVAGALLGVWQIRTSLVRRPGVFDREVAAAHWRFGNWLFAGRLVSHAPRYVTAALLSATLSVSAYGAYRAAVQLIHAANIPMAAVDNLLRPRLARDALRGPQAVWRTMFPIMVLGVAALTVFAAFLLAFGGVVMRVVYGPEYSEYADVLLLVALQPVAGLVMAVLTNALVAFGQTRALFIRSALGAVVGSGLGSLAIVLFGLPASGAIPLFTSLTSIVWLAWVWRRLSREYSDATH